MQENKKIDLFLTAISPYTQTNIINNDEKKINGKDFVLWGSNNDYPTYLLNCYNNCATLQSIINGTTDFVVGNDIKCNIPNFDKQVNKKGDTIADIVRKITIDLLTVGSFSLQIIRNMAGNIAEIYWLDVTKLRSDEKNEVFYYSEDWNKYRCKTLIYPKFNINDENATSIYYFKTNNSRTVYGSPIWSASTKNIAIDIAINEFHLNELNNNFMGSKLISFNNGIPDQELKLEIEKNLNEKFSGAENAGRIMVSFAQSKDNAPEIINLATDDFAQRYEALEKRNREQIFVAFRAQPILFGLQKENNGFSQDEYLQAFALYNRTVVMPIQQHIINSFNKIFGTDNSIVITPFSVEVVDNTLTENDVVK